MCCKINLLRWRQTNVAQSQWALQTSAFHGSLAMSGGGGEPYLNSWDIFHWVSTFCCQNQMLWILSKLLRDAAPRSHSVRPAESPWKLISHRQKSAKTKFSFSVTQERDWTTGSFVRRFLSGITVGSKCTMVMYLKQTGKTRLAIVKELQMKIGCGYCTAWNLTYCKNISQSLFIYFILIYLTTTALKINKQREWWQKGNK